MNVSSQRKVIQRDIYELEDYLSGVGGLYLFLRIFFSFFVSGIREMKLTSLLANRLYVWEVPPEFIAHQKRVEKLTCRK